MDSSFYNDYELKKIGIKKMGNNVLISRNAHLYRPALITIGNNVRIDDFCIVSGNVSIGSNVHISAGSFLYGGEKGIVIDDYVNISSRCVVYALSDDFSNSMFVGPMSFSKERILIEETVIFNKYSCLGSGSIVLPGSILGTGTAVGAMSLVKGILEPWVVYCGIPCKALKKRKVN